MAFKAVKNDGMSVYKAARVFGVPESTLRDRHLGLQPTEYLPSHGPDPLFSKEEEKSLVDHMTYMSNIGYGYSRQSFLDLAFEFAVAIGKKSSNDPTFKGSWYQSFKKRWPEIHLAKPEKLAIVRAKATSQESLDKHFQELEEVYEQYNLGQSPHKIWNIDESGLLLEHSPPKVLCPKGATPQAITSPRGKNVTLIGCGNAAGSYIPPYFIFPGKRWSEDLLQNTCPGTAGEMSETGWSNSVTFENYLTNHFLKYVKPNVNDKHLIIFDGHRSHVSLTLKNWGNAHGIVFFILPPHTSHVTQPLDVACFGPLKAMYNIECQKYLRENPGQTVTRYVVGELSSRAYLKAFSPANLVSAFRKTGVFPLQKSQIQATKLMPSTIYKDDQELIPAEDEQVTKKTNGDQFLEQRKIVAVKAAASKKRKFITPSVVGDLSSSKNLEILESRPASKKSLKFPRSSPVPCCSKENIPPSPENDHNNTLSESDDEELCCVCKRRMPPEIKLAYVLEFARWAQCDECDHWTHLKYCTQVKVIRRESRFLCPHCDPATSV